MDNRNDQLKRQMHNWAFRKLQAMLEWKAAEYGICVERIPPAFTSQTCSKCGHQSSTNRDSETGWFECNECGYSVDGDYNAVVGLHPTGSKVASDFATAKNIGLKLLTLPEGKRPSGLGDGHLALKSGMLNGNGDYTASSTTEADRESTDKPTTSAVGR